jgi:hypothetical protein
LPACHALTRITGRICYVNLIIPYAIETSDGQRIGYVPVKKVSIVRDYGRHEASLATVNYETVPWKRFRVTISRLG